MYVCIFIYYSAIITMNYAHGATTRNKKVLRPVLNVARDGLARKFSGSLFQSLGPTTLKEQSPKVLNRVCGTVRSFFAC